MNHCKTCRFMANEREDYPMSRNHRTCVRIIHGNDCRREDDSAEREPAAVLDGSGYAARLVVLPSFGCVLHEPRDNQAKPEET
jgi:hypothetical protein